MKKGKEKDEHRERMRIVNRFTVHEEEESSSDGMLDLEDERQLKLIEGRCDRVSKENSKEVLEKVNKDDTEIATPRGNSGLIISTANESNARKPHWLVPPRYLSTKHNISKFQGTEEDEEIALSHHQMKVFIAQTRLYQGAQKINR